MKQTTEEKIKAYEDKMRKAHDRRHQALALRDTGMTVQEVGDAIGVTKQRASKMIKEAIAERDGS